MPKRIQRKRTKDPRPGTDRPCYYCEINRALPGQNGYCSAECRFLSKVEKHSDGCWIWRGARHSNKGYGRIDAGGKRYMAHTFAYELLVGPTPEGLQPDHSCTNTMCVNPAHIEWVTGTENVKRANPGSHQSRKTNCPKGHPYSGKNLIVRNGRRYCRTCDIERQRRYRETKRNET